MKRPVQKLYPLEVHKESEEKQTRQPPANFKDVTMVWDEDVDFIRKV